MYIFSIAFAAIIILDLIFNHVNLSSHDSSISMIALSITAANMIHGCITDYISIK